jgi:hypothetical protein
MLVIGQILVYLSAENQQLSGGLLPPRGAHPTALATCAVLDVLDRWLLRSGLWSGKRDGNVWPYSYRWEADNEALLCVSGASRPSIKVVTASRRL